MRRKTPCFSRGECQEILWSEYAGWDFVKTCERCPRDLPKLCERREWGTF
nr:MAG TPA: Protein KHNYN FUNCTION [Bacteriophage sp.]